MRAAGIQGYRWEKHDGCRERLVGDKQSRGSVCLGFLRGDSSSQSLSNGNQLTANKAIASQGLFAFVVDLQRGGLCLLCFILPNPSKGGKRHLYRAEFTLSPPDFIELPYEFSQSERFADTP